MNVLRPFPVVVFAYAVLCLSGGAAVLGANQSDYERARALFVAKDYAGTIAVLDPYLRTHPNDASALALRGDSRASLNDDVGALKDYDAAIVANPSFQYAYATRCDTRRDSGDLPGALTDCNKAIALDPQDALAREYRGDVHFDQEDYPSALTDYDKSIELGRNTASIYAARCNTERLAGKPEAAPADCERSLTLAPQNRLGLWARGRLSLSQNHYEDAISDLSSYIAQQPKSSDNAYYFRGYAYNRLKQFSLALADEQTYIDRHALDADAHAERAIARYNLGDKAAAAADLDSALKGYREAGDAGAAARVEAMIAAAKAGGTLP